MKTNTVIPQNAKWAFTTRNVDKNQVAKINPAVNQAKSGDLVLVKILSIGSHKRIQLANGRVSESHIGDTVVLCCGDRYAPDQFEGVASIQAESADLLAGGGIVGTMQHSHNRMSEPTQLMPLGLLTYANDTTINIQHFALPELPSNPVFSVPVVAITGTAMNSGKTTAAFSLVNGLKQGGHTVAAIKITGTGAFGDFNAFLDAGADVVLDFTDAGMATTYKQPIERIIKGAMALFAHAINQGCDVIVVELGDGILQNETWQVLQHPEFRSILSGVIFAAPDALSAISGYDMLKATALPLLGISGLISCSPLLCGEYKKMRTATIFSKQELTNPEFACQLIISHHNQSAVA